MTSNATLTHKWSAADVPDQSGRVVVVTGADTGIGYHTAEVLACGGQYYGPEGFAEQRGHPKVVQSSAQSHDEELQRRLWTVSEELTGVSFGV
jgi:hypothetical protein